MGVSNTFNVVSGKSEAILGLSKEESIMGIPGRVALRLEQRVKVPERALNIALCGHLIKAHLKEDLSELSANLKKRVEVAALRCLADCI